MGLKIGFFKSEKKNDKGKSQSKRKVKNLSSKPVKLSNIILEANLDAKYDVGEQDSFIRTQYDGKPAIFGLALFIDSIGGFSSSTRSDEDKGSIIEYINSDVIHHITSKEILNKNIIIFLPTRDTLEEMGEYTSLFGSDDALYHIVYILKDGFKYVDTGKSISFNDVISIMEDGSNFEEVLPISKEDKEHALIYDLPDTLLDGEPEKSDDKNTSDDKEDDKKDSKPDKKDSKKRGKKSKGGFFGFGKKKNKDEPDELDDNEPNDKSEPIIVEGDDDDGDDFDVPVLDDEVPENTFATVPTPSISVPTSNAEPVGNTDVPVNDPTPYADSTPDNNGDGNDTGNITGTTDPDATPLVPITFTPNISFTDDNHIDVDGEKFVKESYIDNSEFYAIDNDLRIKVNTRNMFNERYTFSEPKLFNYEDMLSDYTERGNDWFAKAVSLMCVTNNNDFVERQEKFKNTLYTEFRSSVDKTLSIIANLYSITTTDTSYGKAIAAINASKQEATKQLSTYVEDTKGTIQKEYDEEKDRWVSAQVKILEGQYDDTHGFELDNRLASVQTDIERQINISFDSKLNEIKDNRFVEAQRAFSAELLKVYDKFENKYNDFFISELKRYDDTKNKISEFIANNKATAFDNLHQLKIKLETDKRLEEETARHNAMMQKLRETFDTEKESLGVQLNAKQEYIDKMVKEYQEQLRQANESNIDRLNKLSEDNKRKLDLIEEEYKDKIERDRQRHSDEIRNYKEQVESLKTSVETVNAGFSSFDARTKGIDRIQTRMIFITVAVAIVVAVAGFFVGNTHGMKTAISEINAYNSGNLIPGDNPNVNKGVK